MTYFKGLFETLDMSNYILFDNNFNFAKEMNNNSKLYFQLIEFYLRVFENFSRITQST